eukprot:840106_1
MAFCGTKSKISNFSSTIKVMRGVRDRRALLRQKARLREERKIRRRFGAFSPKILLKSFKTRVAGLKKTASNIRTPTNVPDTHSGTPVVNHGHQPISRTPINFPDTNHGHKRPANVSVPPSVFDRLSHPTTFAGSVKSQFSDDGTPTVQHTYE